jgi:crotonobetainyl-CoA:carnitine CoA-transferase CaiB-like acyl-CoA transferase
MSGPLDGVRVLEFAGMGPSPFAVMMAGGPPPAPGQHTAEVLRDWGFGADAIAELRHAGAVG